MFRGYVSFREGRFSAKSHKMRIMGDFFFLATRNPSLDFSFSNLGCSWKQLHPKGRNKISGEILGFESIIVTMSTRLGYRCRKNRVEVLTLEGGWRNEYVMF